MTDTIREQIISALETRMDDIRRVRGYNTDAGKTVFRAQVNVSPDDMPCVVIFPGTEAVERASYKEQTHTMEVNLQALDAFGDDNPSEVAELLLGDLIECATARKWDIDFNSGGTEEVELGETITGATSGATGVVDAIDLDSGSWSGGNAAGTFTLRRVSGTFQNAENLNISEQNNVATTTSTASKETPETGATGGLAQDIRYIRGGTETYPSGEETHVGTSVTLEVAYKTVPGNPYVQ